MKNLDGLMKIAIVLIVLWIVGSVTRFVAGALLNLVLLAAVVLLIIGFLRRR